MTETYRFYVDIKAESREQAESIFACDSEHECEWIPSKKITHAQLLKFLGIENNEDLFDAMEPYWGGWDGWYCNVEDCGEVVGLDTGDMAAHMLYHTIAELKKTRDDD